MRVLLHLDAPARKQVGVLAIRGDDAAFKEFNQTFNEYLTCELQCRFSPAVSFELVPLGFKKLFTTMPTRQVDFMYVNPSAYSCIESEWGASSLVSQIGYQTIGSRRYEIEEFGGVIFRLKERSEIKTLQDIKGRSYAAASISGLGSGQAQFRMFVRAGMSYINDPAQIVFTSNQGEVVKQVEKGNIDVGFVRTNQLEKMAAGKPDPAAWFNKFEIIEKRTGDDAAYSKGEVYPFPITTDLFPEWNVGALPHVDHRIMQQVQAALLRLRFPHPAAYAGNFKGWRPTMSYMLLRNMQEDTGFIQKNQETGAMQCIRGATLWDSITCPAGYFKLAKDVVEGACAAQGRKCRELEAETNARKPYQCVCRPCKKSFEVEVQPLNSSARREDRDAAPNAGCAKMTVCGTTYQAQPLVFKVTDNRARAPVDFKLTYRVRDFKKSDDKALQVLQGFRMPEISDFTYGIRVVVESEGLALFEIYVNNEQISESPLFVRVEKPVCRNADGEEDQTRVADEAGVCVCAANTARIGDSCVPLCPKGTGGMACELCKPGTFNNKAGHDCKACPPGTFSATGAADCTRCKVFIPWCQCLCRQCALGVSRCGYVQVAYLILLLPLPVQDLPGSLFQPAHGQSTCSKCPINTENSASSGDNQTGCVCISGFWRPDGRSGAACIECPK